MLTAKVTCVKTPPGFVGNVRFGYVTTGMYMETASYSDIKGCNLNSEMFCYLVIYLPYSLHFILDFSYTLSSVISFFREHFDSLHR